MKTQQIFDASLLDAAGLNRHAVFNIDELPRDVAESIRSGSGSPPKFRQLILIGHAGRRLWEAVKESGIDSPDPIDDFTVRTVARWFADCQPGSAYEMLYPGTHPIGLQRLGHLAGWHHPTPFMVGIDQEWGTWFAYRAAIVSDTHFPVTQRVEGLHPCVTCAPRSCIGSCPGGALAGGQFDLGKCVGYRKQEDSQCKATCLARTSCPVGSSHRYSEEQIRHTYSISMRAIERYY